MSLALDADAESRAWRAWTASAIVARLGDDLSGAASALERALQFRRGAHDEAGLCRLTLTEQVAYGEATGNLAAAPARQKALTALEIRIFKSLAQRQAQAALNLRLRAPKAQRAAPRTADLQPAGNVVDGKGKLSTGERQVLALLARGLSNKAIGLELGISMYTCAVPRRFASGQARRNKSKPSGGVGCAHEY